MPIVWWTAHKFDSFAGYMLNLVAKHLNPTEIGSLRESFLAMVHPSPFLLLAYTLAHNLHKL